MSSKVEIKKIRDTSPVLSSIKSAIQDRGYSQDEISKGLGLEYAVLSRMLSAQQRMPVDVFTRLCNFLEIEFIYVI